MPIRVNMPALMRLFFGRHSWLPLMTGHPFWEATFDQHLGWLLVRGFTVLGFWIKQICVIWWFTARAVNSEWTHMWLAASCQQSQQGWLPYTFTPYGITTLSAGVSNHPRCIHKGLTLSPELLCWFEWACGHSPPVYLLQSSAAITRFLGSKKSIAL